MAFFVILSNFAETLCIPIGANLVLVGEGVLLLVQNDKFF